MPLLGSVKRPIGANHLTVIRSAMAGTGGREKHLVRIGRERGLFGMDWSNPWLRPSRVKEIIGESVPPQAY